MRYKQDVKDKNGEKIINRQKYKWKKEGERGKEKERGNRERLRFKSNSFLPKLRHQWVCPALRETGLPQQLVLRTRWVCLHEDGTKEGGRKNEWKKEGERKNVRKTEKVRKKKGERKEKWKKEKERDVNKEREKKKEGEK